MGSDGQQPVVIVNLQAYRSPQETASTLQAALPKKGLTQLFLAAPLPYLVELPQLINDNKMIYGANAIPDASTDSFTASVSALLLKDAGATFVVIGKDGIAPAGQKDKLRLALKEKLIPVVIVGESLAEFDDGKTEEVLTEQVQGIFGEMDPEGLDKIYLVYEGPWSHSASDRFSLSQVAAAHQKLQKVLEKVLKKENAKKIKVLQSIPNDVNHVGKTDSKWAPDGYYLPHGAVSLHLLEQLI
jgi:triosephosphate isomerase